MHASQAIAPELGSTYPVVGYWAVEEADAEESALDAEQRAPSPADQDFAEQLDEAIFAGIVALR